MSERIVLSREKDVSIFTVNGDIVYEEVRNTFALYYPEITTKFIIWDFTNGSMDNISVGEFRDLAGDAIAFMKLRKKGTTVFVSPSDNEFALLRMYTAFSEILNTKIEYESFRDIKTAKEYLATLEI